MDMLSHTPCNFFIWDMLWFSHWVWLGFFCELKNVVVFHYGYQREQIFIYVEIIPSVRDEHEYLHFMLHFMCQNMKIIAERTFECLL